MRTVTDSRGVKYQKADSGTCYHADTPTVLIKSLEIAMQNRSRVRVFYGDTENGIDWMEEHDVTGRIGRSTGTIKIPLMINNSRSMGGPGLLDNCIVKLVVNKRMVYFHPKYKTPKLTVTGTSVLNENGNEIAKFKTEKQAQNWKAFITGERFCK